VTTRGLLVKLPLAMLAAGLMLITATSPAFAEHVQCGDVITQDATLDSDVVCPYEFAGAAITIAADDVTLDLAGHAVRGVSIYAASYKGIVTDATRSRVAVVGGRVIGFATAINLEGSDSRIERVTALDSGIVGFSLNGDNSVVRRNEVRHTSEIGIYIQGDRAILDRNVVRGPLGCARVNGDASRLTRNLLAACYWAGSATGYSSATIVSRNTVTGNASGFSVIGSGARVERNDFSGNAESGVGISDPEAVVDRNMANDNSLDTENTPQGGIEVFTPGTIVSRNRADRNAEFGIWAVPGVIDGGGNKAHANGNPLQCLNIRCK
jgi:hypothetical protein